MEELNGAFSLLLTRLETLLSPDHNAPIWIHYQIGPVLDRLRVFSDLEISPNDSSSEAEIVIQEAIAVANSDLEITPNDSSSEAEIVIQEAIAVANSVINHPSLHDEKLKTWIFNFDPFFLIRKLRNTLENVIYAMEEQKQRDRYNSAHGIRLADLGFLPGGGGVNKEIVVRFHEETILADLFAGGGGVDEEIVVGFDKETTILADRLTGGINKRLEMISIVGMPGLGKTTLARKVYNHPFIVHHFHIRAWSFISQVYSKRDILIAILSCVIQHSDDEYYDDMDMVKLTEMVYRCLKCKRYLVVLDDIWDRRAWDDLKLSFPDDNNGSKIMLSSRLIDLDLDLRAQPNFHLRFLTQDESLFLLAMKVFQLKIIPGSLRYFANQIARKCQGLPLAIVVISGLLKSKSAARPWWKDVAKSASSYISSDMDRYMDTLSLSYNHLPQHLRPLFLFLGVFREDYVIPVRKLIWLWVAEGLIHQVGGKSLEEIAMDSFMELLNRGLVVNVKTKFDGGIKKCRLHDLLRDLCLKKAEEEKFSPKVYWYGRRVLSYDNSSSLFSSSISSENGHLVPHIPHSFLGTPLKPSAGFIDSPSSYSVGKGCYPREARPIPWEAFKLLRIMDLESISILSFPNEILQVVHLRYLAIRAKDGSPPTLISNLLKLQTLAISSRRNITVPQSTWKLLNLRHLYIKSGENLVEDPCFEEVLTDDDRYPTELENLQTLSQVCPSSHCHEILARSPNLRKIGFCGPLISEVGNLTFPDLGFSDRLEALKLLNTYSYPKAVTSCNPYFFPEKLKRLTLSSTGLDWKEMWTLGMLPNLEVLKLKFHACIGDEWETVDGGFGRLKYLKFQDLDIVQWKSSSEHFPSLQHFLMLRCSKLKEIPSGLGHILTLELIEVDSCSDSAVCSALEIKKEQEELGNDFLKVLTTRAR